MLPHIIRPMWGGGKKSEMLMKGKKKQHFSELNAVNYRSYRQMAFIESSF